MEEVSRVIARFLAERSVDWVFGLYGGYIQTIGDHAARLGTRIIDVPDKHAAVQMARAHSELRGNLNVAIVTAGPGMTNAITGIANAYISHVPLLIISGIMPMWPNLPSTAQRHLRKGR